MTGKIKITRVPMTGKSLKGKKNADLLALLREKRWRRYPKKKPKQPEPV
jgi:hypothetical protein